MKTTVKIFVFAALLISASIIRPSISSAQFYFMENDLVGETAPPFTLPSISGAQVSFEQLREGKKSIIFFWATWCPHCRTALKDLNAKQKEIADKGIKLAIIDLGESKEAVVKHLQKNKITLDVLLDQDSVLGETYGLIGVPTFFFVDAQGIIRAVKHSLPEDLNSMFPAPVPTPAPVPEQAETQTNTQTQAPKQ